MHTERVQLRPEALTSGLSVRLLALETSKARWTTALVGGRAGRYIVMEMPTLPSGAPVALELGTKWAVTFISDGAAYNFSSEVLGHSYRIVPLLFMQYPKQADVTGLRAGRRHPVNLPALFHGLGPETEGAAEASRALALDISAGGLLLASPVPLEPEATIELSLHPLQAEPMEGIVAQVRGCQQSGGSYYLGLAFMPATPVAVLRNIRRKLAAVENPFSSL